MRATKLQFLQMERLLQIYRDTKLDRITTCSKQSAIQGYVMNFRQQRWTLDDRLMHAFHWHLLHDRTATISLFLYIDGRELKTRKGNGLQWHDTCIKFHEN
jgi:hypothetical protein